MLLSSPCCKPPPPKKKKNKKGISAHEQFHFHFSMLGGTGQLWLQLFSWDLTLFFPCPEVTVLLLGSGASQ